MSNGQLAVGVLNVRELPADLHVRVGPPGFLVLEAPAPGSCLINVETQLPELRQALDIISDLVAKAKPEKRRRRS